MYPTQVVATHRRLPRSTALMVATAFALGALTALGVKGALDQRTQTAVVIGATTLVTRGDMSAAAYAATHPAAVRVNDMSAAAYAATHAIWSSVPPWYGPGSMGNPNDMSAAAYAATHPAATGP